MWHRTPNPRDAVPRDNLHAAKGVGAPQDRWSWNGLPRALHCAASWEDGDHVLPTVPCRISSAANFRTKSAKKGRAGREGIRRLDLVFLPEVVGNRFSSLPSEFSCLMVRNSKAPGRRCQQFGRHLAGYLQSFNQISDKLTGSVACFKGNEPALPGAATTRLDLPERR
jgi:hypothetical protein